ncbi:DUF2382 domain-containing protein, partial [Modestobacter sp. NPDC013298]|uniref:DUF2382 domain-containing protein n=1 Tax=Modestobacter sp. NPDC013298 TaxID=3155464 RepID=UPI0033D40987
MRRRSTTGTAGPAAPGVPRDVEAVEAVVDARLRKYVVTEDVTTTVPVSHEEVRIEREPIT